MGVRITSTEGVTALFDSVSGFAFGPTMSDPDEAEAFLRFVERESDGSDPRTMPEKELGELYARFHNEEWVDA